MPNGLPTPIGGFTRGFAGGAQLGLQIQERQAQIQTRLGEIQKEIEKCDVMCCNCHTSLHYWAKH